MSASPLGSPAGSPAAPLPPPGLTVGGYEMLARIGEGGMGVVHLARQPGGPRVALKVIRLNVVGDDEGRIRLAREVNSLRRVRSPHVAEIVDADPWGPVPFVATRYVPGLSLHDHVREEGPIRGADLVWFARCLAEAVQAVHAASVVHRDIKPANVVMEGRSPVLIDFGLARLADDTTLTGTGWLLGTPGYLAPEVLCGETATTASDVHSWAATVAFAGTGNPPFGTGPVPAVTDRIRRGEHVLDGLDPVVLDLVDRCLNPHPAERPTLEEVLAQLREREADGRASLTVVPDGADVPAPAPMTMPIAAAYVPRFAAPAAASPTPPATADSESTVELASGTLEARAAAPVAPEVTRPYPEEGPTEWQQVAAPGGIRTEGLAPEGPVLGGPFPGGTAEAELPPDSSASEGALDPFAVPEPVAKPPLAERARRWLLLAGAVAAVGAATAAYPYLTVIAISLVVWLVRGCSAAGSARLQRRQLRGQRWYDGPQALLSAPWHLLATVPSSLVLLVWALGIGISAALLAFALNLGAAATLGLLGAGFAVSVWLGPGGGRVRGPLGKLATSASRRAVPWLLVLTLVVAAASFALALAFDQGTQWAPASGGPISQLPGNLPSWPPFLP